MDSEIVTAFQDDPLLLHPKNKQKKRTKKANLLLDAHCLWRVVDWILNCAVYGTGRMALARVRWPMETTDTARSQAWASSTLMTTLFSCVAQVSLRLCVRMYVRMRLGERGGGGSKGLELVLVHCERDREREKDYEIIRAWNSSLKRGFW